jgi:hypothetical protein
VRCGALALPGVDAAVSWLAFRWRRKAAARWHRITPLSDRRRAKPTSRVHRFQNNSATEWSNEARAGEPRRKLGTTPRRFLPGQQSPVEKILLLTCLFNTRVTTGDRLVRVENGRQNRSDGRSWLRLGGLPAAGQLAAKRRLDKRSTLLP